MAVLRRAFERKAAEFADVLKMGRTQLQDAVPMTLGQEFSHLRRHARRGRGAAARGGRLLIREINLGAHRHRHRHQRPPRLRGRGVPRTWPRSPASPLVTAPNLVEATQDCGAFVQLSGVLKRVAVKLSKTCNDLRLLSSGPARRLRRDQPAADAGGLVHHAGQGQPGDPGSRQPDRLRGHRQRRDRDLRRRSRAAAAQRLRADHRAQPVQERRATCATAA